MKPTICYCMLLTFFLVNGSLFCQNYKIIADIPYTTNQSSNKQKLDIYIPDQAGPMPCLIWIHGGAWLAGSKEGLAGEVDTLLHHGYVIVSIGYRLSSDSIFPAQIFDCKSAIRYIKANAVQYKIDSSKIAVAGSSAGGHLAALVGTSSGIRSLEGYDSGNISYRVQAVIDFYGPTDFLIMDELPDDPPGICHDPMIHLAPDSPESLLLGCNIEDCPEKVRWANPVAYVSPDDPPFLIFHGTNDCTVTPKSSVLLKDELIRNGIQVELHLLPNAGHGGNEFYSPGVKSKVLSFLEDLFGGSI